MSGGEMIANFNTAPPPGIWITWAWLGVCFVASAVLIVLDALLRSRVILGINLLQNANRRAQEAEDEIIRLESKVEAKDIEILYLRNENETLRELARRKGSYTVRDADLKPNEDNRLWEEEAEEEPGYEFNYRINVK
jgi:hypothetical protein